MALTDMATRAVTDRLPKVIKPKAHAVLDYAVAGAFITLGAFFWKTNKRAAIAAMACGGATAATALMTDYPGGVKPLISFETHGKIDAGMAGFTATVPTFLAFGDEAEAKYFRGAALIETIITGMTDFSADGAKVLEMPRRDWA
jgi:Na+/proline symporter